MKFIFDFDDVLFNNTKQFKEYMYECLEKAGISRDVSEKYYKTVRENQFWLKDFLRHFSLEESTYEKMLNESKGFVNTEMLALIKKLGKENCYIVTHGNEQYQRDKIRITGIKSLVHQIVVISNSKKNAVEKICTKHKNEKIIFIDDKAKHFENLDFKKYPNLKTILYDERGLKKLMLEIKK